MGEAMSKDGIQGNGGESGQSRREFLSVALQLSGRRCLVVGGGRIGGRKAATLAAAGARVVVVAPDAGRVVQALTASGAVRWRRRCYTARDLTGAFLVVAATASADLNRKIGEDARVRGLPVCVASSGAESDLIFPAVYADDELVVAVHSHGRSCRRSRELRDAICLWLKTGSGERLAMAGASRAELAPVVRERLRRSGGMLFREAFPDHEMMVLDTCHRWEVYLYHPVRCAAAAALEAVWRRLVPDAGGEDEPPGAFRIGAAAFHHLLRVACGLASPLPGETEIVGQLRAAQAAIAGPAGGLSRLIDEILAEQREIRAVTGFRMADGGSWATAIVAALKQRLSGLASRKIVVLGHGRMGAAVARFLCQARAQVAVIRRPHGEQPRDSELAISDAVARALIKTQAVVLTFTPPKKVLFAISRRRGLVVIDLVRRRAEASRAPGPWLFLDDFGDTPRTGGEVERLAKAEHLAAVTALRREIRNWPDGLPQPLRLGTRRSPLALAQTEEAVALLRARYPDLTVTTVGRDSPGDRDRELPLSQAATDFFTRDLDMALLGNEIDVAIHSAKDLPEPLPAGLVVAAVTPCLCPWDCLVAAPGMTLADLSAGARIGVSSERRRAALQRLRPDLCACEIRGPVDDRLRQWQAGKYDALILAAAGLVRLGQARFITQVFTLKEMPVVPSQGALALVVSADAAVLRRALAGSALAVSCTSRLSHYL